MSVKVWKANNEATTHALGTDVHINDAHLVVTGAFDDGVYPTIAIYAPGQWRRTQVENSGAS